MRRTCFLLFLGAVLSAAGCMVNPFAPDRNISATLTLRDTLGRNVAGEFEVNGSPYSYSWSSEKASACKLISPTGTSGVATTGDGGVISPGHVWYPAPRQAMKLTLECSSKHLTVQTAAIIRHQ